MLRYFFLCVLGVWMALGGGSALAGEHEKDVTSVLRVTFLDQQGVQKDERLLTMTELQALPSAQFTTNTIWTDGVQQFRGVWLGDLMINLGVTEGTIYFSALNEYLIEIALSEMVSGGPMLAYEWNGKPMSARDKGPLWIVFPYDSDQKYQTESVYAQSIWQLDRIEVSR